MSNRTRKNNERADRQMESNDIPEIPDKGGDTRRARPPFGPKERRSLRKEFERVRYR